MAKQPKPEDALAIAALRERALLTIDFYARAQEFPFADMYRENIERVAATGSLRRMRLLAKDIDDMAIALAPHERDGLEAILRQRLGVDKDAERAELSRQVASAITRGTVASEKERRRLEDYAEMLEATGGDPSEIAAVRNLLQHG